MESLKINWPSQFLWNIQHFPPVYALILAMVWKYMQVWYHLYSFWQDNVTPGLPSVAYWTLTFFYIFNRWGQCVHNMKGGRVWQFYIRHLLNCNMIWIVNYIPCQQWQTTYKTKICFNMGVSRSIKKRVYKQLSVLNILNTNT